MTLAARSLSLRWRHFAALPQNVAVKLAAAVNATLFRANEPSAGSAGLTENQASERWCPFVRQTWADKDLNGRFATTKHPSFNMYRISFGNEELRCPCIASGCMAWRWDSCDRGHCGLAGQIGVRS